MHIPSKFKQNDDSQLMAIMREYPFATLITNTESGVEATHLPVVFKESEGKFTILAHIARANKLWESVKDGSEILLIFNGPNCYISPNYYPTKKESGKAVPTWNYVVVHVKGNISFINDTQWIYNMIDSLTEEHESKQDVPWSMSDAPTTYINKMLPAIVGIEISVSSIEGQWKLSQNQPEINKLGVIQELLEKDIRVSQLVKEQI
ncbi:FMN-binding negative transcriptional regulator [Shewanella sp.]|uniref:FMN-binding negative transcriptional regulator n=1 Tax=Shewanella sp. TaxID=50422 RepID=UPI001EB3F114|nr:FMN-binding negative transcriptional regulator [Shewanella sp.]NRB25967.1 FMN-binding negative transcriptional regulator [Shewanella sp.]